MKIKKCIYIFFKLLFILPRRNILMSFFCFFKMASPILKKSFFCYCQHFFLTHIAVSRAREVFFRVQKEGGDRR